MRVITDALGGSELTRAFLDRSAPPRWYPSMAVAQNAKEVSAEFSGKNWLASLSEAFGSSASPARARLERAAKDGLVVTTGEVSVSP